MTWESGSFETIERGMVTFRQGIYYDRIPTPEEVKYSTRQLSAEIGQAIVAHLLEHGQAVVSVQTEIHIKSNSGQALQMIAIIEDEP